MVVNAALQTGLRIGEYELLRQLGAGGMGDVWLAADTRADRKVALKFIKPHLLADPSFRTRFLNEARTLGRLEHDRIVTLYTVVEDKGHMALVLRYIDGRSLADRVDAEGALPLDAVLATARDILPALGFAHERGIVHRDIKPQNVLLDGMGRAFLTDFGIAVGEFAQRGTMTGFSIGTPHYMSPEQIQNPAKLSAPGGHRSDIYSFGVVLYELLTGNVPFGGKGDDEQTFEVQRAHCMDAPPPPRSLNAGISEALEALVLQCLEKSPDARPQTCGELLQQLEGAIAGAPVATSRPPVRRVATVMEGTPASVSPAAPRPAAAPGKAASSAAKRPNTKLVWLGAGGLVIAGSIAVAVMMQEKAPESTPAPPTTVSEGTSGDGVVVPPQRGGSRPAGGGTGAASGSTITVPPPAGPVKGPLTTLSATPAPTPAAPTTAAESEVSAINRLRADEMYQQALRQKEAGDWCRAKATADKAVEFIGRTDPGPTTTEKLQLYRALQKEAAAGCDL